MDFDLVHLLLCFLFCVFYKTCTDLFLAALHLPCCALLSLPGRALGHVGSVTPRHEGLPGPGVEPVSPALAGGFFTPGPPAFLDVSICMGRLYFVLNFCL